MPSAPARSLHQGKSGTRTLQSAVRAAERSAAAGQCAIGALAYQGAISLPPEGNPAPDDPSPNVLTKAIPAANV
jgi:hypothetical protein